MKKSSLLLPSGLRPFGLVLFLTGLILLFLRYQFNYKPGFLNLRVFALYTYYIESRIFSMITNQMVEEVAGILLLTGKFLIAFTKEKEEFEEYDFLRLKSFFVTAYLSLFYLIFSLLFFFGFGFVGALTFFMGFWLISYLLVFRFLLYRFKKGLLIQ